MKWLLLLHNIGVEDHIRSGQFSWAKTLWRTTRDVHSRLGRQLERAQPDEWSFSSRAMGLSSHGKQILTDSGTLD